MNVGSQIVEVQRLEEDGLDDVAVEAGEVIGVRPCDHDDLEVLRPPLTLQVFDDLTPRSVRKDEVEEQHRITAPRQPMLRLGHTRRAIHGEALRLDGARERVAEGDIIFDEEYGTLGGRGQGATISRKVVNR